MQLLSVAVFGQPSSIRPELAGISRAVKDSPVEEDLNVLTDSLFAKQLLRNMQQKDFPLWPHRHTVGHLLAKVVHQMNQLAAAGSVTRLSKGRAHRAEPLNDEADTLEAEAARAASGPWHPIPDARVPRCNAWQRNSSPASFSQNKDALAPAWVPLIFPSLQPGCCDQIRAGKR